MIIVPASGARLLIELIGELPIVLTSRDRYKIMDRKDRHASRIGPWPDRPKDALPGSVIWVWVLLAAFFSNVTLSGSSRLATESLEKRNAFETFPPPPLSRPTCFIKGRQLEYPLLSRGNPGLWLG